MKKGLITLMTTFIFHCFFSISAYAYDVEVNGIYYNLNIKTKTAEITSGNNKYTGDVTIPESITIDNESYTITSIGGSAFFCCDNLTSVIIPNSVTTIGSDAFLNCYGLTSVTIPNTVTNFIGGSPFNGCLNIKDTIIVNDMFVYLPKKYSGHYSIPENITNILAGAFSDCMHLSSVTIPNTVTTIGNSAFWNCSSLSSISIPNSVTSIGEIAFRYCDNIKKLYIDCAINPNIKTINELYIGDNVNVVYNYFKNLQLLKIVLGKNVSEIQAEAFYNTQIEEFTITSEEPPYCNQDIFDLQKLRNAKLYVPENKIDYYKTTEPWSNFGTIKSIESSGIETIKDRGITIQSSDGFITICGLDNNEKVCFYGIDGKYLGTATTNNGITSFGTQSGTVVVIKIGKENVKIAVE